MIYNYRINSSNVAMISILLTKPSLTCINKFGKKLHARFKALIKQFTDSNTGQYAKKSTNVSHIASLKIMAKKSSVNNASKIINIIKMKNTKKETD